MLRDDEAEIPQQKRAVSSNDLTAPKIMRKTVWDKDRDTKKNSYGSSRSLALRKCGIVSLGNDLTENFS